MPDDQQSQSPILEYAKPMPKRPWAIVGNTLAALVFLVFALTFVFSAFVVVLQAFSRSTQDKAVLLIIPLMFLALTIPAGISSLHYFERVFRRQPQE